LRRMRCWYQTLMFEKRDEFVWRAYVVGEGVEVMSRGTASRCGIL